MRTITIAKAVLVVAATAGLAACSSINQGNGQTASTPATTPAVTTPASTMPGTTPAAPTTSASSTSPAVVIKPHRRAHCER